ncbi:MAG: O-antigen ligase family protein [Deltaproteobacteria bacterium]|nr:O-antigen ligase family protein [Deltaproteobacteria bacterium]
MQPIASSLRQLPLIIACLILVPAFAYAYVQSFALGLKAFAVMNIGVAVFLGLTVFLRDLRTFFLFSMVFAIPFGLGIHLVRIPLAHYDYPTYVEGIVFDGVRAFLALLFFIWLMESSFKKQRAAFTFGDSIGVLLLVWILYSLVVGWFKAVDFRYTFFECVALFLDFLVFLYLANNLRAKRDIRVVMYALFAGQTAQALFMMFQLAAGINYNLTGFFVKEREAEVGFRAGGFFGGDIAAAEMLAFMIPVGLAYCFLLKRPSHRMALLLSMFIMAGGIFAAKTRSAGFLIIAGCATVFALGRLHGWISKPALRKALVIIFPVLVLLSPFIIIRFQQAEGSWEGRLPLIHTAAGMFKDNWVLGVGASNYLFHIVEYTPVRARFPWQLAAPVHNEYLLHLAERGVIGTVLFYWILIAACVSLWRTNRSPDRMIACSAAGALGALIGSIAFRFFHPGHHSNFMPFYCVFLALAVALAHLEAKRQSQGAQGFLEST